MQDSKIEDGQSEETTPSILGLIWRGLLMGLAEVVPGVSGGTIALITGIYSHLVNCLASLSFASVRLLTTPRAFYEHHRLGFLLPLIAGMVVGIWLFAQLIVVLLERFQPVVWAFFFGVIATSVVVVGKNRSPKMLLTYGLLGLVASLLLTHAGQLTAQPSPLLFFLAGMIAVSAWILPAISGSYLLLILGLYEPMLEAVRQLDLVSLASLGAGCVVGLLLFIRALKWVLEHHYERLLSLLTGFLLGSVLNLWPWQWQAESRWSEFVSPDSYATLSNEPAWFGIAIVFAVTGGVFLWFIASRRV
jgi:putative membrane protein